MGDPFGVRVDVTETLVRVSAPGPQGPAGGGGGEGVDVTTYGAKGDGTTDDTTAIQSAIDSIGANEQVRFPAGVFLISRPLRPKRGQTLTGVYSTKYEAGPYPFVGGTIIRADPDTFDGTGVILSEPSSYGVTLERLAIVGPGRDFGDEVHGVYFGPRSTSSGERAWTIDRCLISSCSGDGIAGHMWVLDVRDTHIAQCRVGLHTFDNDGLLDARIIGCQIYFNRDGGIVLDGGWTGAIDIIGCRVERSGNRYGYPATPIYPAAPGIRIRRGQQISLTNVNTDANTGHGLHIGNPSQYVYNISVTGCAFARDGGGTQALFTWYAWVDGEYVEVAEGTPGADCVTLETFAGVFLERCQHVKIANTIVGYGASDDGGGGPISPGYGLRVKDTTSVEVVTSRIEVLPLANSILAEGTNYTLSLQLPQHQLATVPVASEAAYLPTFGGIGSLAYQNDLQTLVVRDYSGDWRRMLSHDGTNPLVLPKYSVIEFDPFGAYGAGIRWLSHIANPDPTPDVYATRYSIFRSPDDPDHPTWGGHLNINVNDAADAYLGTPVVVFADGKTVQLARTLVDATATDASPALEVGVSDTHTAAFVEFRQATAGAVAGVLADGQIYGADGTEADRMITLGQLQTVVAASTDFADFQTRVAAL